MPTPAQLREGPSHVLTFIRWFNAFIVEMERTCSNMYSGGRHSFLTQVGPATDADLHAQVRAVSRK
jgi:hypothetical protein